MTWLSEWAMPDGAIVWAINAAITSTLACAMALLLGGMRAWSLPARHAHFVVAIAASLLLPWGIGLIPVRSPWRIDVESAAMVRPSAAATIPSSAVERPPVPASTPAAPELGPLVANEPATKSPRATSVSAAPIAAPAVKSPSAPVRYVPIIASFLCGVWIAGIVVMAVRSLCGLARLRRWLKSTAPVDDQQLLATARWATRRMGLPGDIPLQESGGLLAPVTLGLIRPRIVVPVGLQSTLSPELLKAVLLHEVAHVARRDLWVGLLQQLAQIAYWWNPLVHYVSRQLADCREQICDDIATGDLAEPRTFAATLLALAERANFHSPMPATLGIDSSTASQLEKRVRRILSSPEGKRVNLTRQSFVGVFTVALLMTATILLAQVQVKPPGGKSPAGEPAAANKVEREPALHDLIQKMAQYERMYLPYDIKAMETFHFPEDLTPQERASNLRADGRKHQRLMEQAQAKRRIWRKKETPLVDDEIEFGSYEQYSDGERIISISPSPVVIDGVKTLEYDVNNKRNQIFNYQFATPLAGVFCLSAYGAGELFSEAFATEEGVELAWDNGDAKLTFGHGKPHWNTKYVLWLSRAHDWHPIRLQRFWDAKDELFHDEWEVTKFVQRGSAWRVAEGTHRYRNHARKNVPQDPRIAYSMDFEMLEEKYGADVDVKQFQVEIPAGAKVREDDKPVAEPPPVPTREIAVTVVDLGDDPIEAATIRLPRWPFADFDQMTTDAKGVARSAKAPVEDVSIAITAEGYRPVTWIMGDVNELRAMMAPVSRGMAVCQGKPVDGVWIANDTIQFRADGIPYVPQRDWDGRNEDWSGEDGRFELKSALTLRQSSQVVPFIAIDPDREKMAIQFVLASELGQERMVELKQVCHVHGQCLLQQMTELVQVQAFVETSGGNYVGFFPTRRELTPEGLQVEFNVRLPPGDYVVKAKETSFHAGFEIPFRIAEDQRELDLGSKNIPLSGTAALKGKPAPLLDVQWRPQQQQATWQDLRGQVVVLDFWGAWCVPCVASMPTLMDIHDQFRDQPVRWIAVHTADQKSFEELDGDLEKLQESAWNKRALPFTAVIDIPAGDKKFAGRTSEAYGVPAWPTLIVIDQQGNVVGSVTKNNLAETLQRLLGKDSQAPKP